MISGSGASGQEMRDTPVMHKFAHGARDGEEVFTVEFIKKYLMYAKGLKEKYRGPKFFSYSSKRSAHFSHFI